MALIFSPLDEGILAGPYRPLPKGVFIMRQLGTGRSQADADMETAVLQVLKQNKFKAYDAYTERGQKDFLDKIIQLIRGCGFGVAIFSEYTPAPTLANIFFEVALCNLLGKPVVLVKSENAKPPSDFVRTEWVTYQGNATGQLKTELGKTIRAIIELAAHYEILGDIAIEAEIVDMELAFERYRQSYLISGRMPTQKKILRINERMKDETDPASSMFAAKSRFKDALAEFIAFIPA